MCVQRNDCGKARKNSWKSQRFHEVAPVCVLNIHVRINAKENIKWVRRGLSGEAEGSGVKGQCGQHMGGVLVAGEGSRTGTTCTLQQMLSRGLEISWWKGKVVRKRIKDKITLF